MLIWTMTIAKLLTRGSKHLGKDEIFWGNKTVTTPVRNGIAIKRRRPTEITSGLQSVDPPI